MELRSVPLRPFVAYFCMEVGLSEPDIPTYSGGLGVLAGDTLRSAADLQVPVVGVTLLHRKGYFHQHLDASGTQTEADEVWKPEDFLERQEPKVSVTIDGRDVAVQSWRLGIKGVSGFTVPLYFLDTSLPENGDWDRGLTDKLYGGDQYYRLCQEVVLGIGGTAMLDALGHDSVETYHMNEGHSALLTLALLEKALNGRDATDASEQDIEAVRRQCVFTTHTPVPAGHDQFPMPLAQQVLGPPRARLLEATNCCHDGKLNMTYLGLRFSHYINGVAMRHGEVSRDMFPNYPISAITNGVHAGTWTAAPFQALFDGHLPQWRADSLYLRYAISIPLPEVQAAHLAAKRDLFRLVAERTGVQFEESVFTIGFARRAAAYKRADLLFSDRDRLRRIACRFGPLQIIYGGRAHPRDEGGKDLIRRIVGAAEELRDAARIVYLEHYNIPVGKLLCAGVDLWLNTPLRPREASGTSGMKAALNGVPSFSVLDGWWVEGHLEGVTGWSIGSEDSSSEDSSGDAASLYEKLEHRILPLFYTDREGYARVMRSAVAVNGSFFNTQRMVMQYVSNAYLPGPEEGSE